MPNFTLRSIAQLSEALEVPLIKFYRKKYVQHSITVKRPPGTRPLGLESSFLERVVIPSHRIPCDDSVANGKNNFHICNRVLSSANRGLQPYAMECPVIFLILVVAHIQPQREGRHIRARQKHHSALTLRKGSNLVKRKLRRLKRCKMPVHYRDNLL